METSGENLENKTVVYLDDEEARLFLKFLEYKNIWQKVFEIRNGSVEFHFDGQKKLQKVGWNFYEKLSVDNSSLDKQ